MLNSGKKAKIKDVLFVKNLRHNLLSVHKLEKSGLKITFCDAKVFIYDNAELLACGNKVDNIYILECNVIPCSEANNCENKNVEVYKLWHNRFGHLNVNSMLKLRNNNMVNGIPNIKNVVEISLICEICVKSKITKLPFVKTAYKKSHRPLELIHSDICGPITPCTYDNKRYFVTFLDDYTHFVIVYLLEHKSELFKCFKQFEAFVTSKFNCRIGSLKCDNGKEYCSNEFTSF